MWISASEMSLLPAMSPDPACLEGKNLTLGGFADMLSATGLVNMLLTTCSQTADVVGATRRGSRQAGFVGPAGLPDETSCTKLNQTVSDPYPVAGAVAELLSAALSVKKDEIVGPTSEEGRQVWHKRYEDEEPKIAV